MYNAKKLFLIVVGLLVCRIISAEDLTEPKQVLEKMMETYKTCSSFACEGEYNALFSTTYYHKDKKTVKIVFSRPNLFRLDWTEIRAGGEELTNSIYTKDGQLYFYWATFDEYKKMSSIKNAIAENAGISSGLSSLIPTILINPEWGKDLKSVKLESEFDLDGEKCYRVVGTGPLDRETEFAISKNTFAILQVKEKFVVSAKGTEKALEEFHKQYPGRELPAINLPDFEVTSVTRYKNVKFNFQPKETDFEFKVPQTAKLVEKIPSKNPLERK